MTRPSLRRTPMMECLETRKVLSSVGGPTADKQYALELINLIRTNPAAAADRFTSNIDANVEATLEKFQMNLGDVRNRIASAAPKPALAYSDALDSAAQSQVQVQVDLGRQTHEGKDGAGINQRIEAAGYDNLALAGENSYGYARSTDSALQAFLFDWGVADQGHFRNLLEPNRSPQDSFTDIGIGMVKTNKNGMGPLVITQDFASKTTDNPQILGVVYKDSDGNNFYTPGEGRGGVTIQATNLSTGQTFATQTWNSGGYQVPVAPNATYRVAEVIDGNVVESRDVAVSTINQKTDFILTDAPAPAPAPTIALAPAPAPVSVPEAAAPEVRAFNLARGFEADAASQAPAPAPAQPSWLGKWSQWREIKAS